MFGKEEDIYIFETHRGLWFEDGAFKKILEPGKHEVPRHFDLPFYKTPKVQIRQVDMRERDLTIKGQEILTQDKVAIRVSIIVQFKVSDPKAALLQVDNYEDRLYSDVQLAARRSLANMSLEEILTNRNNLSEDILNEVKAIAERYGVDIMRADVKDLIFPGDVQDIMNKVLKAERLSQAQMVEAKSRTEIELLESKTQAEKQVIDTETRAKMTKIQTETDAQNLTVKTEAEIKKMKATNEAERELINTREESAKLLHKYPELLRIEEIKALENVTKNANARIFFGVDPKLATRLDPRIELE